MVAISSKRCLQCGKVFDVLRSDALYCSSTCRSKAYLDRQPAAMEMCVHLKRSGQRAIFKFQLSSKNAMKPLHRELKRLAAMADDPEQLMEWVLNKRIFGIQKSSYKMI